MARAPKRERGPVRRLLGGAVALGSGAMDCLLHPGAFLRRSKNARAAAMARKNWRDDAQPAGEPLLRRASARARGAVDAVLHLRRRAAARARRAVDAVLHPGRCALAVIRNLLQRARAVGRDFLQRVLRLVPEFIRRLLRRRQPFLPQGEGTPPPSPPPSSPPPRRGYACMYPNDPSRRRPRAPTPPLPPPPPPPPFIVDGEEVPEAVVKQYALYCRASRVCQKNTEVCHFCVFDRPRSSYSAAKDMLHHCSNRHSDISHTVRCNEASCSVRLRPGRELALHKYFFHVQAPDWWYKYI